MWLYGWAAIRASVSSLFFVFFLFGGGRGRVSILFCFITSGPDPVLRRSSRRDFSKKEKKKKAENKPPLEVRCALCVAERRRGRREWKRGDGVIEIRERPGSKAPCVHQQLRLSGWQSANVCVCVLAVPAESGEATCPGCSSVRARLTAEVGVHSVLCQAAYTHKHTNTHSQKHTCSLALHNLWQVLMCDRLSGEHVRFMRCDKVGRVKDLQCGVWPGSTQPLGRYRAKKKSHSWTWILSQYRNCMGLKFQHTPDLASVFPAGGRARGRQLTVFVLFCFVFFIWA